MNCVYDIVTRGDIFQVLGDIDCNQDGTPRLSNSTFIRYKHSNIYIDISKLVNLSPYTSQKIELVTSDKRYTFCLNLVRGKLNGQCSVKMGETLICSGTWADGRRNGQFIEYCDKKMVFNGGYEDGVRCGFAKEKVFVNTENPDKTLFYKDNSWAISTIERTNNRLLIKCYSTSLKLTSLEMYNEQFRLHGIKMKFNEGRPAVEEVYQDGNFVLRSKMFINQSSMICYHKNDLPIYQGGYEWIDPHWTVMTRQGSQRTAFGPYYNGEFLHGKRSGKGTLFYNNGVKKYDGMWWDDLPHGIGVIYDLRGNKYEDVVCDRGNFSHGLQTYNVFTYTPKNYLLSMIGIQFGSENYDKNNPTYFPSFRFDYACSSGLVNIQTMNPNQYLSSQSPLYSTYTHMTSLFQACNLNTPESILLAEELHIPANTNISDIIWHLEIMVKLTTLRIGDNALQKENNFSLVSLPCLMQVVVGKNCFTNQTRNATIEVRSAILSTYSSMQSLTDFPGCFIILDCPRLKSVEIGRDSFLFFADMIIESMYYEMKMAMIMIMIINRLPSIGAPFIGKFDSTCLFLC